MLRGFRHVGEMEQLVETPLDQILRKGHVSRMLIYKIFRGPEWADMQAKGETLGAPIDLADGFIHFSTSETVARTAELYFEDVDGLALIAVESDGLEPLKWKPSRGGVLFPHLFRALRMADVVWHRPLPIVDGTHQFPDL